MIPFPVASSDLRLCIMALLTTTVVRDYAWNLIFEQPWVCETLVFDCFLIRYSERMIRCYCMAAQKHVWCRKRGQEKEMLLKFTYENKTRTHTHTGSYNMLHTYTYSLSIPSSTRTTRVTTSILLLYLTMASDPRSWATKRVTFLDFFGFPAAQAVDVSESQICEFLCKRLWRSFVFFHRPFKFFCCFLAHVQPQKDSKVTKQ